MFNVSTLVLDDTLSKCVATKVVLSHFWECSSWTKTSGYTWSGGMNRGNALV